MNIYEHIDYTLLKPTATYNDIWQLCEKAIEKGCATVCIPPHFVNFVYNHFPTLKVCTVVGFPLGYSTTKYEETEIAIENGAEEIDMVINIGEVKNGNFGYIADEINQVHSMIEWHSLLRGKKIILKVIIETCYLTEEEIATVTRIVDKSSADYVKTSTGFGTRGASFEDILIMKKNIHNETKIKASGGIRTKEDMMKYLMLGCDRIGTSQLP